MKEGHGYIGLRLSGRCVCVCVCVLRIQECVEKVMSQGAVYLPHRPRNAGRAQSLCP